MNTKTRIKKLESVKHEAVDLDNVRFRQEVQEHGIIKYFIDAVQVDEAKYKKEFSEYLKNKRDNTTAQIIYYGNENGDGLEKTPPKGVVVIYVNDEDADA